MPELRSSYIGELAIEIAGSHIMEATPFGRTRRIDYFESGWFRGPRVDARVVKGSADALLRRNDGVLTPDVRLVLEGVDGRFIYVQYRGLRHGPDAVIDRIAAGERVDPSEYYLRTALLFETDSERHGWLNKVLAVGVGRREPGAAIYDVHEVL